MIEKYLLCLFKQYCNAKGLDSNNTDNMKSKEFIGWINQNNNLLCNYIDYLYQIDNYPAGKILEVGKGKFDSILVLDYFSKSGTGIVSPFAETMGKSNSIMYIDDEMPLIQGESGIIIPENQIILTHNPYFEGDLLGWPLIHNSGANDISIGMFGDVTDEDHLRKIRLLEQLSKQMKDDYSFYCDTVDGKYFCSLSSNRKIKELIKTLH